MTAGLASVSHASHPKYAEPTISLSKDHAYFVGNTATDYWSIAPYYVPQHNPKACSVASSVMILNALRAGDALTAADENVTFSSLLEKQKPYAAAVGKLGQGMVLDDLQKNVQSAIDARSKSQTTVQYSVALERFDGIPAADALKKLQTLLKANESNPKDFVIVNFLQGVLTGDSEGMVGHISPVGAYDAKTDRVLIMDPDRQYYEPYWVKTEKLLEAMNTTDKGSKKARGLIWIQPKK